MPLRIVMPSRVVRLAGAASWPGTWRRGLKTRTAAEAALESGPSGAHRVGWGFISLYTLAYMSTSLLFLAPVLVTLALKVSSLVGIKQAPGSLAPSIPVVLAGWCIAQLFFNALLATMVAVLPDQIPSVQRGLISGVLGVCTPIASVCGTFLVKLFAGSLLAMFLAPCAIGGLFVLLFAVTLKDRRLARADKPKWSLREFASTFYVNPRNNPDFSGAFASRFMFVMAYAFLITYQAYYLLDKIGTAKADVPQQIFLGTVAQSAVIVAASLIGGKVSDRTGRRKIFVLTASIVYGLALFVVAIASSFSGFLVGMAISGLGFGVYAAVDLALVVIGGGSYGVLYAVAGLCAIIGAFAILPVRRVR